MRLFELHTLLGPSVSLHHQAQSTFAGDGGLPELRRACFDSRRVQCGDLFCALDGSRVAGRNYFKQAIAAGAAAILCAHKIDDCPLPQLLCDEASLAKCAGQAAAFLAGQPSEHLANYAITGTNGKSTIVHLLAQAESFLGRHCARVGTLGMEFRGEVKAIPNTTPAADVLHDWLGEVVGQGANCLAIEASSHGLHQHRLAGINFSVIGWTNLSHDHLDYHKNIESYAAAKALAVQLANPSAIALLPFASTVIEQACLGAPCQLLTWALNNANADIYAQCQLHADGLALTCHGKFGSAQIKSSLIGEHNGENLLLAWSMLCAQGVDPEAAAEALSNAQAAPGRLQLIAKESPWHLYVDYAHTPDALKHVLGALRKTHPSAQLGVVFGAGGDRDREKRAPMGAAVATADWCVVTSDNPRCEDPKLIVEEVARGVNSVAGAVLQLEVDRRLAIKLAVEKLNPGDVLLVAGKGHEDYQEINGQRHFFDDRVEIEEAVKCLN